MAEKRQKHVAVCGGGLVGSLNACFMARRGFKVELFEMRPDIRTQKVVHGRSINLALSVRGRDALKFIGMEDAIIKHGVPMYSRMIHDLNGKRRPIPYGKGNQHIMSVDRRLLNELLLDEAEKYPNVTTYFSHKVQRCNFETGELFLLKDGKEEVRRKVDLIVGNDGAFSVVRQQMMKSVRFNYQQEYIPHGYMELTIPPAKGDAYAMEVNYLHIWPRNEFMMIALPNEDKSYTTTLFMPFEMFEAIDTEDKLMDFYRNNFPDSLPLLGEENLKRTFFTKKPSPLLTIKCSPYHIGSQAVLMGDAAHAMVPFYGQGMNCGFEDCLVLYDFLDKYKDDFTKALSAYTEFRTPDAKAICDLAVNNYIEMRALVNTKGFLARKMLDRVLNTLFPNVWVPLYTMVTFSRIRYHECVTRRAWQDKVLHRLLVAIVWAAGVGLAVWTYLAAQYDRTSPWDLKGRLWTWAVNIVTR